MDNNYKPLIPHSKIKTFRSKIKRSPGDLTISEIQYSINNSKFHSWLDSPLHEKDYIVQFNQIKYKKKRMYTDDGEEITKKTYVSEFINNLTGILSNHGYSINNNKQFRNTIASFIYKNSR